METECSALDELCQALGVPPGSPTKADIETILKAVDIDQNNQLDFYEFITVWIDMLVEEGADTFPIPFEENALEDAKIIIVQVTKNEIIELQR